MAWGKEEWIERKAESLKQPTFQFYKVTTETINQLIPVDLLKSVHKPCICGFDPFGDRRQLTFVAN
jgi:hypothetical protein